MDTPEYGETLIFVYIKYQPILVLPKVYKVYGVTEQFMKANHFEPALGPNH